MISLRFKEAVAILEPMGRSKNLHHTFTASDGYELIPCAAGWLITHPKAAMSAIKFPCSFVLNENISTVEGTEQELLNTYCGGLERVAREWQLSEQKQLSARNDPMSIVDRADIENPTSTPTSTPIAGKKRGRPPKNSQPPNGM